MIVNTHIQPEIPESHIPKPKIYPVINDSFVERFSPIYKSVDIDKIESHQRSKGAKPSEKLSRKTVLEISSSASINILSRKRVLRKRI